MTPILTKEEFAAFKEYCIMQHDVVCNQKYAKSLPYSMHLKYVDAQALRFITLIPEGCVNLVRAGCYGHDLIEDARISYNDIKEVNADLAEIIFLCTEMRGRNRGERKNEQFYEELSKNRLAVFVKLCDVTANATYSVLENTSMYERYQAEYPKVKTYLWSEEYQPIFDYLDKLFTLD